ncbi:hypothetical protein HZC34_04405 [Candidatus Saganbacteria bacterium]|nr:hypothetical protein [Candidatus Saganbacteria bacterium]
MLIIWIQFIICALVILYAGANLSRYDDLFYKQGPILANVSQNHVFTALLAIVLTSIAVVGLIFRSEKKLFWRISWDSIAIILTYFISIYILYRLDGIITK